CQHSYGTPRTF
nr:immunoglobulin light chain junction region [Macaca mulatta]MOV75325.1 immunoglobulin light chain junction region [Macaca mulatta]MOW41837.1 immunoglobulin light chain junction region [Macaca mulatta]